MKLVHLIPAPLHRALYRLAFHLRRRWVRGRVIHGCSIVAQDGAGRFLLVRHSYGADVWAFPSGGMHAHEDPMTTALREFREELGCGLNAIRQLATITEAYHGADNVVHVFSARVDGTPRADRREVVEARFFERDAFPANLARNVRHRLALFDKG